MESFLKHILIFILVLLLTFFSHSFVPIISNPLAWDLYIFETQRDAKVSAEERGAFLDASELMQKGKELYEAEKFSQAVKMWDIAAKVYQKEQDKVNQALALNNLSLTYQELGKWKDAEDKIFKALDILRSVPKNLAYAQALDTRGHLEYVQGKTQKALDYWKQAARIYKQLNDNEGIIINKINQAQALQSLGSLRQAEDILNQLKELLENHKYPGLKIARLRSLANTYALLGDLNESEKILNQKHIKLFQKLHNIEINKQEESRILLSLGNIQRALANRVRERREAKNYNEYKECKKYGTSQEEKDSTNKALESYKKASDVAKEALKVLKTRVESTDAVVSTQIQAEINQLSLYVELSKENEAQKLWKNIETKNLLDKLPSSRSNIYAHINLAQSLSCFNSFEGDYNDKRKELLSTAIKQAQEIGDKRAESYALGNLGHWYESTNQLSEAQKYTKEALPIAKAYHSPDIAYRWQWQLGRIYKAQGNKQEAIKYYQEAVETLKSARKYLLGIDSEVQFSFRDIVEPVYRELVDLLLTDGKASGIENYLQQAINRIDELQLAEIENYFRCNLSQLVQVNQEISKNNWKAAFIYPIVFKDRLEVIYQLPGNTLEKHTEHISSENVEQTARKLRTRIVNNKASTNYSKEIYKWLIKPLFDKYLTDKNQVETLVFVLDGYLKNVPIAALWDEDGGENGEGEYLIEKQYSLALQSGSQVFDLKNTPQNHSILAAGIDTLNNKKEGMYYVEGKSFTAIDISELEQIGAKKKLINHKFTQSNLQQEIKTGKYSVVHIASHGNFSSNPDETFIVAYDSKKSQGKLLKARDLDNLFRVNKQKDFGTIKLLVLSACDTAKGDSRAILGLAGLAVKAGVPSTLSTLWRVEDNATIELMENFYKKWKEGITKAEALHQAQLALLKNSKTQHPYKWSPYILIGNWQ